jgi:hypothetical protein
MAETHHVSRFMQIVSEKSKCSCPRVFQDYSRESRMAIEAGVS